VNRPIFLTRTQRLTHGLRHLLATLVVFGLFIGLGLLLGYGVTQ
jgi:hypothetical protein